jgi:hypothetical protein
MNLSRPAWCHRFSEKLLSVKEVRQETADNVAHQQYAVVSHLLPEEAARIYALDVAPSRNVGGPE